MTSGADSASPQHLQGPLVELGGRFSSLRLTPLSLSFAPSLDPRWKGEFFVFTRRRRRTTADLGTILPQPENQFAFSGEAKNRKYAFEIIHECHEAWKRLLSGEVKSEIKV